MKSMQYAETHALPFKYNVPLSQGWINHWSNTLLYWFFMSLDCSPPIKIVEFLLTAFSIKVKEPDNFGIYRFWVT